ncbi:penicillin-binding protein 1C [Candidatus Peregrinibacteria bacterium]|nr:penicillin-binding protein 1C [Candidatus Peregrinibacteria bacterium]
MTISLPEKFFGEESSIALFTKNGERIQSLLSETEMWQEDVPIKDISPYFLQAIIATEDKNFFSHSGIDISATFRAIKDNLLMGKVVSGASTLSQQVARNFLDISQRNFIAKIRETLLALKIEKQFSKENILEMWANHVSFGGNIRGIQSASMRIFGKSPENLDFAEATFLAGIPKSPERLNPFTNFEAVKKRQEFVLEAMESEQFITEKERKTAIKETLFLHEKPQKSFAAHFSAWIQSTQEYSEQIRAGKRKIETTLDGELQKKAESLVSLHLERLSSKHIQNAAALVWDVQTGDVLAYVGNADFSDKAHQGEVNILTSGRSVGSTLKPFLYLLAFEKLGWNPETRILDEPSAFESAANFLYEPKNYDLEYRGEISIKEALAESRNIPAVKTLSTIGEESFFAFLKNFGIDTNLAKSEDYGLSSALGSFDILPTELAHAYGVLARGGKNFSFRFLEDSSQNTEMKEIAHCEKVFEIAEILSDKTARINSFGTKNPLNFSYAVAAKTGTTRNFRDNWTVGFSEKIGVLVWVGNADGSPMEEVTGITGAGPLFHDIMEEAMQGREKNQKFSMKRLCQGTKKNDEKKEGEDPFPRLSGDEKFRITSPLPSETFRINRDIPPDAQKLEFTANQEIDWFVNGEKIGTGKSIFWIPQVGKIEILGKFGGQSKKIIITVQ